MQREIFVREYGAILERYLQGFGEEALQEAYEIGRKAIANGWGLLDIAGLHHQALSRILRQILSSDHQEEVLEAIEKLFVESLLPFEMIQRGFQEMVTQLKTEMERRRQAEEALRAEMVLRGSEELFRTMADTAPLMVWVCDADLKPTYFNKKWLEFTGKTLDQILGDAWKDEIHPEDFPRYWAVHQEAGIRRESFRIEHRLRRADGQYRWMLLQAAPRFSNGVFAGYVGSCVDIDENRRAQEQIQLSLQEKEVLLREVHHRVKNNLQVISSLLELQSEQPNAQLSEWFRDSQSRIQSMALIHESLYRASDVSQVDIRGYIQNLADSLVQSYGNRTGAVELKVEVDDLFLNMDTAIPCGLLINELVSNALKHAFRENEPGLIRICLHSRPSNQFVLSVSDNGIGLPLDFDLRQARSLGLRLVNALSAQMNGKLSVQLNSGTTFSLTFSEIKRPAEIRSLSCVLPEGLHA